ncbi:MAG: FAD-linked oxidase [Bdellovibrio sp. ArHS]|uniref:FAD-binding oxidoreductase n=1 Tax=Bdellovibrio sp. ArHS TaxID=1569284 RepID=UPI000583DAA1|nr:FAD-binding oxidoreductase [Bdellovibrio sp. ArHS]KHD87597.1 MAG: FAD-linked oxidase [Bdellovibrio sp. ArHS]
MSPALIELESFLQKDQIKTDEESLKFWGKDWTTYYDIKATAIVFPRSTDEVVSLVKWARKNKIGLVPSGGRTGLSGSAVAFQGEVVVSFDQMNKIKDFSAVDQSVVIEAGVVTETLQEFAHSKNLFYPVDFAAAGSSQMGGNIATNAGGIKVVRYGLTRDWIIGLKVVTGAGEVLELNNGLVKNATGYDLRHLFIGSEGTLGFIIEATIRLAPAPPPMKVLVMAVSGLEAVMKVFAEFKTKTSLVAFEMFADNALKKVLENTGLPAPLETQSPFYVLAEVEARNEQDEEHALGVFEKCVEEGWALDGVISQSDVQAATFWRYREDISESLAKYSPYKNDIAVTISQVPPFMKDLEKVLTQAYPTWEVVWFGHIGDGNLHINILRPAGMTKEDFVQECRKVDVMVFDTVKKYKGSISAEHGVGLSKRSFLSYTRSEAEIALMRGIKNLFDPDGIMNPGKVLVHHSGPN